MNKLFIKAVKLKDRVTDNYIGKIKLKRNGSQMLDFLIIALIVVIVGAALMAIMKTAMPELFNGVIDKINSIFTV